MSDARRKPIENWEVESYRFRQPQPDLSFPILSRSLVHYLFKTASEVVAVRKSALECDICYGFVGVAQFLRRPFDANVSQVLHRGVADTFKEYALEMPF